MREVKWKIVLSCAVLLIIIIAVFLTGCTSRPSETKQELESEQEQEKGLDWNEEEKEGEVLPDTPEDKKDFADNDKADGDSLAGKMRDDKLLKVLSMSKQEVIASLGEPDIEDWWAGLYIYYEDASSLLNSNDNGVTRQKSLMVWIDENENVVMTYLSSFLDIESGMSFTEAMSALEQVLEIKEDQWGEHGKYYMEYNIEDYNFKFYSDESPDGPIESILVTKGKG